MPVVVNHTGYPMPPSVTSLPGIELVDAPLDGAIDDAVAGEIVLTRTQPGPNLADLLARGAKWVHTLGTGVDEFAFDALNGQILTCARGISAEPIGEWVFAQMLAHAKGLPDVWLDEAPEQLHREPRIGSLRGATVVVLGMGGIGTEVARLSLALDMNVIGVRRTSAGAPLPGVRIAADLADAVSGADHLVLAAPHTPATHRVLDAGVFAAAKPGLHVVNVSRGPMLDQEALRAALDDGTVALASLDVTDPEPLPAGHWMYAHPRVHVTPHVSWAGPGAFVEVLSTFADNYRRWQAGEPLAGVVDIAEGY